MANHTTLAAYYAHLDVVLAPTRKRGLLAFRSSEETGWSISNGFGVWLVEGARDLQEAVTTACLKHDDMLRAQL